MALMMTDKKINYSTPAVSCLQRADDEHQFWNLIGSIQAKYSYSSSLYTSSSIAYYHQRFVDDGYSITDLSFVYQDHCVPVFGFVGALCELAGRRIISAYEIPAASIELPTLTRAHKKAMEKIYDEMFCNYSPFVLKVRDSMPFGYVSYAVDWMSFRRAKSLTKLGYSRFIDLTLSESELRACLRKRYSPLINKGIRDMQIAIHDSHTISWSTIEKFRELHIRESGRETRSIHTWDQQYHSILSNQAFCITAHHADCLLSAGLFTLANNHCYYGVSASRRDRFDQPLFHAVMWTAILYAKSNGALVFETGTDYPLDNISYSPSQKEKAISTFKDGFGGRLATYLDFDIYIDCE